MLALPIDVVKSVNHGACGRPGLELAVSVGHYSS